MTWYGQHKLKSRSNYVVKIYVMSLLVFFGPPTLTIDADSATIIKLIMWVF